MNCATSCSAPKGEKLSPASCRHVETVFTCMLNGQTIRQQSGTAVYKLLLWCQVLLCMDGLIMMASWPFTGCVPHQHQMWSWSCYHASVCVCANCQIADACQMDCPAQTCVSCRPAATKNKTMINNPTLNLGSQMKNMRTSLSDESCCGVEH